MDQIFSQLISNMALKIGYPESSPVQWFIIFPMKVALFFVAVPIAWMHNSHCARSPRGAKAMAFRSCKALLALMA